MEIIRVIGTALVPSEKKTVLTLGFFDGVHAGHAALLARTREEADRRGALPAVCSFAQNSGIKEGSPRLMQEEERLAALAQAGMERVYLLDFSSVRDMSCEDFCKHMILDGMQATAVVCGFNFRFGRAGMGDASTLRRLLAPFGVDTVILPPVTHENETVSSSAIRAAAEAGDVEKAALLLGKPLSFMGEVVHGKALGKQMGYPTANLAWPGHALLPARGVYAVRVEVEGQELCGIANVGVRPTVEEGGVQNCEVHLFGGAGDLYGKRMTVRFYHRLRDEMKFDNLQALCAQIAEDEAKAKEYFHE